jgi:acetyl-CoA carboxylase carboxyl transferase subunit alpha
LGGAHHNYQLTAGNLKSALWKNLADLKKVPVDELLEQRYQKYRLIGEFGRV